MMDAEKNLRELLKAKAEEVPNAPVIPDRVLRHSKVRRSISASLASALLIAASVGVLAGIRSIVEKTSIEPAHPAPSRIDRSERTTDRESASTEKLVRCASAKSGGARRADPRSRHEASTQVPLSLNLGPAEILAIILGSSLTATTESVCGVSEKVEVSPPSGAKGGRSERGSGGK